MTKYTKQFTNETEYTSYISSQNYREPLVSVMNDKRRLGYNNHKEEIIATIDSNPELITIARQKSWIPSTQTYLTKHEAEAVTRIELNDTNIKTFDEFRYFTSVTHLIGVSGALHGGPYGSFESCKELTSIILPNSITEISAFAFYVCKKLTHIIIPKSVTQIKYNAFGQCTSLEEIVLPNTIKTFEQSGSQFQSCISLKHIEIPDSITILPACCFSGCTNLSSVTLHEGLTKINGAAFQTCENLTNIDIPSTVIELDGSCFSGCRNLSEIIFHGNTLTTIGSSCFVDCQHLHEIKIPESVTSIGQYCFKDSGIKNIIIPEGVTTLSDYLFTNCGELSTVVIPESVERIGSYTFAQYDDLQLENSSARSTNIHRHNPMKLTIPKSVAYIGSYCFSGLISEIKIDYTKDPYGFNTGGSPLYWKIPQITATTFSNIDFDKTSIYIQKDYYNKYRTTAYWSSIISYLKKYD
jgi:hypothetical protein